MSDPIIPLFRYVDPKTLDMRDPDTYEAVCRASVWSMRRAAWPEVCALLAAHWTLVLPDVPWDTWPWSWGWKSPPKRKGGRWRRWADTNQAYKALMRQTPKG